ncbi:MAG TPA: hypothetical protein VF247_08120 [Candidatus Krumholzibacteria bacterium]
MHRVARYAWSLPNSAPGAVLAAVAVATGGRAGVVRGVLEAHGGVVSFILHRMVPLRGGASAMTLGHVVLGRDAGCLERTRAHERVHVRQCEAWGPFFIPAYLLASVLAAVRGRHFYRDNPFEREAFARAAEAAPGDEFSL